MTEKTPKGKNLHQKHPKEKFPLTRFRKHNQFTTIDMAAGIQHIQ